jgi:phosphoglycolate phosphatase-like HAD superfamily hydrolase
MYPIGAAWGFRSREELLAHGAAAVIERPDELLQHL